MLKHFFRKKPQAKIKYIMPITPFYKSKWHTYIDIYIYAKLKKKKNNKNLSMKNLQQYIIDLVFIYNSCNNIV